MNPVSTETRNARRAIVVRGGWEGHRPVEATELFLPVLQNAGFDVRTHDSLEIYADADALAAADLVVQCWTEGVLTPDQESGLVQAVRAGTGFAGWHGGIVATFATSRQYLRMVGGQFLYHPLEFLDYAVHIERPDHPILEGIGNFAVHTEQYWMLSDSWNEVLATTTIEPDDAAEFDSAFTMPAVWVRKWGHGRIFFSAIGHAISDLQQPEVFELTSRGLLWASR